MRVARYHPPIPAVRFRPVGPERVERDPLAAAVSQEARLILSVRTSQPPFRVAWFFLLRAQQHDPAGVHVRAHVSHLVPEVADRKLEVGAVCSVPRVLMPAGHVVLPHTERGEVHFVPASALRLPLSELADLPQKLPRPRDLELLREILRGRLVLLLHVQVCEMGLDPAEGFPVGARWRNVGPRARREGAQLEVLQDSRERRRRGLREVLAVSDGLSVIERNRAPVRRLRAVPRNGLAPTTRERRLALLELLHEPFSLLLRQLLPDFVAEGEFRRGGAG
mmetsp:Transcript_26031/g.65619  ORF Transcript_26031/g.65619 Transcript_26031/m.65619 type:complete len:279 (+) Transcript_26031:723-1559(+)